MKLWCMDTQLAAKETVLLPFVCGSKVILTICRPLRI